jgi:hypothetical protein
VFFKPNSFLIVQTEPSSKEKSNFMVNTSIEMPKYAWGRKKIKQTVPSSQKFVCIIGCAKSACAKVCVCVRVQVRVKVCVQVLLEEMS